VFPGGGIAGWPLACVVVDHQEESGREQTEAPDLAKPLREIVALSRRNRGILLPNGTHYGMVVI